MGMRGSKSCIKSPAPDRTKLSVYMADCTGRCTPPACLPALRAGGEIAKRVRTPHALPTPGPLALLGAGQQPPERTRNRPHRDEEQREEPRVPRRPQQQRSEREDRVVMQGNPETIRQRGQSVNPQPQCVTRGLPLEPSRRFGGRFPGVPAPTQHRRQRKTNCLLCDSKLLCSLNILIVHRPTEHAPCWSIDRQQPAAGSAFRQPAPIEKLIPLAQLDPPELRKIGGDPADLLRRCPREKHQLASKGHMPGPPRVRVPHIDRPI